MGINTVAYINGNYKAYFLSEETRKYVEAFAEQDAAKKWFRRKAI